MIIPNGHIRFKRNAGGGLDAAGFPIPSSYTYSGEIECQYRATLDNLGAKNAAGEPFNTRSYTILIEDMYGAEVTENVELWDAASGGKLGEFSALKIQKLPHVGLIRIHV